jgi:saccharopine dehydrogenase-like NADP-dependent oxidoreductase
MHTVLVIGGAGFFGQRIGAALSRNPSIRLLLAGRNRDRILRAADAMGLDAEHAVTVDATDKELPRRLTELQVNTLIHTAGPFQGQDYTVAQAAVAAGCHYIDLADGRQFVAGIQRLDELARSAGVTVVSGASSVPALSSAVVDCFAPGFERLESIRIGISSGGRAPGIATVRGVFSYAGKPMQHLVNGSWQTAYGWGDLHRHAFPAPVGTRWMANCDVPDLDLLPQRYPGIRTVSFQAGFAGDFGHLVIWSLARLVRAGFLRSLAPLAAPLNRASRWVEPLLSDTGGMFVRLDGVGIDQRPHTVTWNLIAGHNHGPSIPCGAAIALAVKLAGREQLPVGAMPCMGLLTVAEYLQSLQGLDIREVIQ